MKEYFQGLNVLDEEERQERSRYWLNLLKLSACVACLLYLLGLAIPANAQDAIPTYVVEQDSVRVRMLPTACVDPVSSMIAAQLSPPQFHTRWKAISSDWKHRDGSWHEYAGCWLEVTKEEAGAPDAVFFFTFSDGTYGQALKREVLKPKGPSA